MKEGFTNKLALNANNKIMLNKVNDILEEYKSDGYVLTLRQVYYQLVSRDIIPNNTKEYAKLSGLLTKGRMAGIVDWAAIEDRGRQPKLPYWVNGVVDALEDTWSQYRINRQEGQDTYIELCIEKDALSSIFQRVTSEYHIRLMVNKGYSSSSAIYTTYERIVNAYNQGADKAVIVYFGDHDPSGRDMIRDVAERLKEMLSRGDNADMCNNKEFEIMPIALDMTQVRKYNPPENPAKITDPRAKGYIKEFGNKSWELDALSPKVLAKLTKDTIESLIDMDRYNSVIDKESRQKQVIYDFKESYSDNDI